MTVTQLGGRKGTRRAANPQPAVRPEHPPRRRQHQVARGDPAECLRDRPAPPRQHLLRERAESETVRRPPADRQGDDDNAAARPAPVGPRLRGLGLRRPAAPRLHPRRPGRSFCPQGRNQDDRQAGGTAGPTVPVVPDAPIGHFRLTVFGGKHGYLVNTRSLCGHTPVTPDRLHRPERQDLTAEASRSRPPAAKQGARQSATLAEPSLRHGSQRRQRVAADPAAPGP